MSAAILSLRMNARRINCPSSLSMQPALRPMVTSELLQARKAARELGKQRDLLLVTLEQVKSGELKLVDPEPLEAEELVLDKIDVGAIKMSLRR